MGRKPKARRDPYGAWIQQLRHDRRLTQQELAKLAGVPQTTLAYWEKTGRLTGRQIILRLASVLDVSLNKLLRPERGERERPS
jgi:transcriptional regulator with XRE-family HTH domain